MIGREWSGRAGRQPDSRQHNRSLAVLGVNAYIHDSAAALVIDGHVVAAAREERFSRVKHTGAFPEQAIAYCLQRADRDVPSLDGVAYYWRPWLGLLHRTGVLARSVPRSFAILGPHATVRGTPAAVLRHALVPFAIGRQFGRPRQFHFVPHHVAHLAGAYFTSPFSAATVVSLDLAGERLSTLAARATGDVLSVMRGVSYPHSLGSFYAAITQYLGFQPFADEYKVMGLAAFGTDTAYDRLRALVRLLPRGRFEIDLKYFTHHLGADTLFSAKLERLLGPRRRPNSVIDVYGRHSDIAQAAQRVLEDVSTHVVGQAVLDAGSQNLCMTGGVALNGSMINTLRKRLALDHLYVPASPDDAGAAAGAALAVWHKLVGPNGSRLPRPSPARPGPSYSDALVARELEQVDGLEAERRGDFCAFAAERLAAGEAVAWFQGGMEFGPRALGGRSILGDPRSIPVRDQIAREVKDRDGFRPFAASVLAESAREYFELPDAAPHMIEVCPVVPEMRPLIPGVTHIDGTCRPHTVAREDDELFWGLLTEFCGLTGCPLLLNTSFNRAGEPIVATVGDALATFRRTGLRWLIAGSYVIQKTAGPVP